METGSLKNDVQFRSDLFIAIDRLFKTLPYFAGNYLGSTSSSGASPGRSSHKIRIPISENHFLYFKITLSVDARLIIQSFVAL